MSRPEDGSIGLSMPRELQVAEAAAQAGAEIIRRYYRDGVTMRSKQSFNLVSDADLESERAIVEIIRQSFPDHAVLGEELHRAEADSEHLWVIDPLDGTNNFAHHVPHFAVSIAYCQRGQPVCGVVTDPIHDDWYLAARGRGAWHNGRRAQVATQTRLDEALIGVGFYYDRDRIMQATLDAIRDLFHQQIHGIRRFGAAALDLCYVGVGSFGAFFEYELAPWDYAAGQLFVVEAGGQVSTCRGEPLQLAKGGVLASNGPLHEAVLKIVREHSPA
jgi:myo-inositol-1(or 4)-monophosphatase